MAQDCRRAAARLRKPASITRTSYQVGKTLMFEGRLLPARRHAHGRMERANKEWRLADTEALTLAKRMTKSFKDAIGMVWLRLRTYRFFCQLHLSRRRRARLGAEGRNAGRDSSFLHHHPPSLTGYEK